MPEPIQGDLKKDRRVRLSSKPLVKELIYGPNISSNILQPLYDSGGLLWPYTPTITDQATVQYDHYEPVHTNQPFAAFKSVAAKQIIVSGTFTAMNQAEARYCIAAIHFLRTITKMFFGVGGEDRTAIDLRGTPPPILLFNAYGTAMFHNVPVIVTTYVVELAQDVDYVEVELDSGVGSSFVTTGFDENGFISAGSGFISSNDSSAWVPSKFNVSVTLEVQNTPDRLRRNFNLNDFRTGKLIKKGGWV